MLCFGVVYREEASRTAALLQFVPISANSVEVSCSVVVDVDEDTVLPQECHALGDRVWNLFIGKIPHHLLGHLKPGLISEGLEDHLDIASSVHDEIIHGVGQLIQSSCENEAKQNKDSGPAQVHQPCHCRNFIEISSTRQSRDLDLWPVQQIHRTNSETFKRNYCCRYRSWV